MSAAEQSASAGRVSALCHLLLEDPVNTTELVAFLRRYKDEFREDIVLSGTKKQLVENIERNVRGGRIAEAAVLELLREAEENGDQRVFYFAPRSDKIRDLCRSGEAVAEQLFGEGWREKAGFPVLAPERGGYTVADFRTGVRSKPRDWVLKIYGTKRIKKQVARTPTSLDSYTIQYREVLQRSICLARWNDHPRAGLLELRVTLLARTNRVLMDLDAIWERLRGAFSREEFEPWTLTAPLRWMIEHEDQERQVYRLGSVRVADQADGTIAFHPHGENESVSAAPSRHKALKALIGDGAQCKSLVVTWLASQFNEDLKDDLRTYLGPTASNELVIRAGTSGPAIDYVTDRLRHYRHQADESPPPNADPIEESADAGGVPIPFEKVRKAYPGLVRAWDQFEKWLAVQRHPIYFNEEHLFRGIDASLDAFTAAAALDVLVQKGYLHRVYRLQVPGGEFVSGEYNSFDELPTKVHDRFGSHEYRAKDLVLVTFYRKATANG